MPVVDSTFPFIQGEALQGQKRPDHVFSDPLGLVSGLGPDAAVDIESGVPLGEGGFCPFGAEKLIAGKVGQDLAGE